jgi:hypothetical protein
MSTPLEPVVIPPTPDGQDVALGHPDLAVTPPIFRRFRLNRVQDITGLSGTGIVAEGVEFSDGTSVVRWLSSGVSVTNRERGVAPTTVIHPDIRSIEALHGHNGATQIEWVDR